MSCLSTVAGCGWAYGFTFTSLPPQTLPQICESWLKSFLMQVCKPCHYALIEVVEPCKLHPMSMWYIYEVFEHLLRLWMGIWLHIHTVTTTDISPDLWKLAEILPDASVQTMPPNFGLCCRTFQTASHVHVVHIWGDWAPSEVGDGRMASQSHHYHRDISPDFESWLKSYLMQVGKPCHYALIESVEPFKPHPMYMAYLHEVFEHFSGCGWTYGFTLISLPPQSLSQICQSLLKS